MITFGANFTRDGLVGRLIIHTRLTFFCPCGNGTASDDGICFDCALTQYKHEHWTRYLTRSKT